LAPQTLFSSDDASFLVIDTASFEPTWALAAHDSATKLAEQSAASVHQQVRSQCL
jgi:hypothetical protein